MPVIPPGFTSSANAVHRAESHWHIDGIDKLRGLLAGGRIKASFSDPNGDISPIDPTFWRSDANAALLWRAKYGREDEDDRKRAIFDEADLMSYIPYSWERLVETRDHSPAQASVNKRVGGRPPPIGADDFWIEVCRKFHAGEAGTAGQTQEQLVGEMVAWIERNKPGLYSDDTVRDKVKAVWKALGITAARKKGV